MTNNQKRIEAIAILKEAVRTLEKSRRIMPMTDGFEAGHLYSITYSLEALISAMECKAATEREK